MCHNWTQLKVTVSVSYNWTQFKVTVSVCYISTNFKVTWLMCVTTGQLKVTQSACVTIGQSLNFIGSQIADEIRLVNRSKSPKAGQKWMEVISAQSWTNLASEARPTYNFTMDGPTNTHHHRTRFCNYSNKVNESNNTIRNVLPIPGELKALTNTRRK